MRRQDWAVLGAAVSLISGTVALFAGTMALAVAFVLVASFTGVAARMWSHSGPGPMSHALRFVLWLPRGPHSPKRLLQILEPHRGERILEVGPGIGIHALPVAKAIGPIGVLDALDMQQAMIADLSARARHAGIANIAAVCGDAMKLPYSDSAFDAVFLITALGEIPDQDAAFSEFRRVIKPKGRLVIGEMMIDPDFVPLGELRDRALRAGFALERSSGLRPAYFASFRPTLAMAGGFPQSEHVIERHPDESDEPAVGIAFDSSQEKAARADEFETV